VGPFTAYDHPHSGRPPGLGEITEHSGQLGDVGAVMEAAVSVDRLHPCRLREREDPGPNRRSHGEADRGLQVNTGLSLSAKMRQPR
jgi:hypothetical protein